MCTWNYDFPKTYYKADCQETPFDSRNRPNFDDCARDCTSHSDQINRCTWFSFDPNEAVDT